MLGTKHVVSFSGGKDSTALLLLALDRCPEGSVVPIFCDTGHEHPETYAYLSYIEKRLGVVVNRLRADFSAEFVRKRMFIARDRRTRRDEKGRRVRWSNKAKRRALAVLHPTGNAYLDLCMLKGRFPSRRAQFCTERLKKEPAIEFQLGMMDDGYRIVSWQGVRRDESHARRDAKLWQRIGPSMYAFRPLIEWTAMGVISFVQSRGVELNPLYSQGMTRVGCMPCINASKGEMREIAMRFPSELERVAEWEQIVSQAGKRGFSSFFHQNTAGKVLDKNIFAGNQISEVIEWSKTTHGGRQYDLLAEPEPIACASAYGLCE